MNNENNPHQTVQGIDNPYLIEAEEEIVKLKIFGSREVKDLRIRSFPITHPRLIPELLREEIKFILLHADIINMVKCKENKAKGRYEIHYYMDEV